MNFADNYFGNSAMHTGYACQQVALIKQWRELWSATTGTTDPMAPFGLVTLAPSGTEGGADIGTMRWAQTANYGYAPNPALPNVFIAQVRAFVLQLMDFVLTLMDFVLSSPRRMT